MAPVPAELAFRPRVPLLMHVGLICPYAMSRPGGVQEHVRGLARALVDRGCEVSVFAPELERDPDAPAGLVQISLGGAVDIPANGSVAPLGIDPRMLLRYDLALDPLDVIHLHEPFLPAGLGAVLRAPKGVPLVGTFHASADGFWPYAIARPLLRRVSRRLDATTAVSPSARDLVQRYAAVEPTLVGNGVDVGRFARAEPDPWASGLGRVALFVGRPERRKGFELAVRAFTGAAVRHADWHLVCVPARPEDVRVPAEAVEGRVHCLGRVPRERLEALHRSADIVLAPSTGGESFGLVVLEGLAGGSAVLASDLPGYRYAGADAARYLPAGDLRSWRLGLEALMDDDQARNELAAAGQRRAEVFDWSRIAEETLAVYASGGATV